MGLQNCCFEELMPMGEVGSWGNIVFQVPKLVNQYRKTFDNVSLQIKAIIPAVIILPFKTRAF